MTTIRISPRVDRIQNSSPYINVYDGKHLRSLHKPPLKTCEFYSHIIQTSPSQATSHAHPDPLKWSGPIGYGVRHIHDKAPFSLWDEGARKFHFPSPEQRKWIDDTYDVEGSHFKANCCYLETGNPPKPVPLTLGCMPVVFVGIDEGPKALIPNASHYANPRINDPCPHIGWPRLSNPNHAQRIGILTALENFADVESITFLPRMTVIDLTHDDNRIYDAKSLPGIVAGRRHALPS